VKRINRLIVKIVRLILFDRQKFEQIWQ